MDSQTNNEDIDIMNSEIKDLQAKCVKTCLTIENAPPECPCLDENEVGAKSNNYIEGLRTEIHNSNTFLLSNNKILTSQFLNELKEKIIHIDELSSLTKAYIHEQDTEIERLKSLLSLSKEGIMKPKRTAEDLKPEHVLKAKEKFVQLKTEIHSLVESLFPDCHLEMMSFMGDLIAASNESCYIDITVENYKLAAMLKDMNIVTVNPYDDAQIKLLY